MKEWALHNWQLFVWALGGIIFFVVITLVSERIHKTNPPGSKAIQLCLEKTKDVIDVDLGATKAKAVPIGTTTRYVSMKGTLVIWDLEDGGKVKCTCMYHKGSIKLEKLLYNDKDLTELLRQ